MRKAATCAAFWFSREHIARSVAFVLDVRRQEFQHAVPMRADRDRVQFHRNPFAAIAVPGGADRRPFASSWPCLCPHHEIRLAIFRLAFATAGPLFDRGHVHVSSAVVLIKYNINR